MIKAPKQRGRPKGTGIDDSEMIERIHEVLMRDPELRPTTAIKSLGVDNESAIRRLRDKYNAFVNSLSNDAMEVPERCPAPARPDRDRDPAADRPAVHARLDARADPVRKSPAPTRQALTPTGAATLNDTRELMINGISTMMAAAGFIATQQAIIWNASLASRTAAPVQRHGPETCPHCGRDLKRS